MRVQVTILCKNCKKRYPSYTAGERLHCECNKTYWSSDGALLDVSGPYEILLIDPNTYEGIKEKKHA